MLALILAAALEQPVLRYVPKHEELKYTFGGVAPAHRIKPGTRIIAWTEDCFDGAVTRADQLPSKVTPAGHENPQTGPFFIEGAEPGDTIVDGGNTNFHDDVRRAQALASRRVEYVDAGTSGGVWGLQEGYCLMVGGKPDVCQRLEPIFLTLAPKDGYLRVGDHGAGHYVKMVHNGIEYGMMQAYAALKGYVENSGEGRWTLSEGIERGVPLPVLTAALFTRFRSREDNPFSERMLAALRNQFGGHAVKKSS